MSPLALIETRRSELGLSIAELERQARLGTNHLRDLLRGAHDPKPATLARLQLALHRYKRRQSVESDDQFALNIIFRMAVGQAARELDRDPAKVLASDPARRATQDADWSAASEVRDLAIYLMNCGAGFRQTDVARAAGVTKQAVSLAVQRVENRSDEGSAFEAMLTRLTSNIMGEW